MTDFSLETIQAGKQQHIFLALKERTHQSRILHRVKIFFRSEEKNQFIHREKKTKIVSQVDLIEEEG